MKTRLILVLAALLSCCLANAQMDTLRISTSYTTHIIFSTDLTYADLSNSRTVAAKIIEQNKNMLAIKAKTEFSEPTSVSALESNGNMHTFIVIFEQSPDQLVIDKRDRETTQSGSTGNMEDNVTRGRKEDAPQLHDLLEMKQRLFHLGTERYGLRFLCEDIISYSDMTYMVFSLKNRSSVSYSITDATFVIESRKTGRRTVAFEKTVFPTSRTGSLSAAGGESSRAAYSFDKLTLSEDQVLKVYFYEDGGQRNLEMAIGPKDINRAANRITKK